MCPLETLTEAKRHSTLVEPEPAEILAGRPLPL